MGVVQSTNNQPDENEGEDTHGITVVNPTPDQDPGTQLVLPARVLPILSIEGHIIDPKRHGPEVQLDHRLWLDIVTTLDKFFSSRADLIATRQSQLQEKIFAVDHHVQRFTDSYINDKHKALARMNEDCRKLDDMNKLLQKCTIQSELCVDMLQKLNFLLPPSHKLESLEL